MSHATGALSNRLSDVRLADTGRPGEYDVLLSLNEIASGEIDNLGLGDLGG